ncbi:hypothetical protein FRC09_002756 [Ceratobasidium sp. 395]|nr:hypothetical protein FRC09_002756 [Ceratobasidium sp. 395]
MSSKLLLLPPELVQRIAQCCAQPDLISLAVLDRNFHDKITPILYQNIRLRSYNSSITFCHRICAGPASLRDYPLVIDIKNYHDSRAPGRITEVETTEDEHIPRDDSAEKLGNAIADMLTKYEISAGYKHDNIISSITIPFLLKSLCIRFPVWGPFDVFLQQQEHLEELELPTLWDENALVRFQSNDILNLPPHIHPRLHTLSVNSYHSVGLWLMNGRPVSTLLSNFEGVVSDPGLRLLVQQASVPLARLKISTSLFPHHTDNALKLILLTLKFCQSTLESLTIVMDRININTNYSKYSMGYFTHMDQLLARVQSFPALADFRLEVSRDEGNLEYRTPIDEEYIPYRPPPPADQLALLWATSCPNLKQLHLYQPIFTNKGDCGLGA